MPVEKPKCKLPLSWNGHHGLSRCSGEQICSAVGQRVHIFRAEAGWCLTQALSSQEGAQWVWLLRQQSCVCGRWGLNPPEFPRVTRCSSFFVLPPKIGEAFLDAGMYKR